MHTAGPHQLNDVETRGDGALLGPGFLPLRVSMLRERMAATSCSVCGPSWSAQMW